MRILAIDLGKSKSVACIYEAESNVSQFEKFVTGIPAIQQLIRACRPDRVVIEVCPAAGWVGDVVLSEGIELQIANTSAPAWRWSNTKRKTDRDDALRLAQLSAVNQLPQVPMTDRATRQWRALIRYRHHLVGRRTQIRNHIRASFDREGIALPKTHSCWTMGKSENGCHRRRALHKDHVWCWDFVFDHTTSGSALKWLSIVDEFTRECLCLKVDRSITSEDVIDTLAELFAMRSLPWHIRSDNGPEFVARANQRWTKQLEIETLYIEPGSPWENGFAESFDSRLRDELLATEVFESLIAARKLTQAWREDYNHHRTHSSLGYVAPVEFAARCVASVRPTASLQQHSGTTLIPS